LKIGFDGRYSFGDVVLGIFYFILNLGFCQKRFITLEPKLLVMCEKIGKALEKVFKGTVQRKLTCQYDWS
jgi:hypothetical protein